jgi:hypothetical protein
MVKRFLIGWVTVYTLNSLTGYFIHHVILGKTYERLMPVLHSEDIKSKIWAFVVSGLTGSFFFTLIYSSWKRQGSVMEGLRYGFFIGLWMGMNMALNTYASTGLVPLSLAMQWLLYTIVQYSVAGSLLAFVFNYKVKFSH